MKERTLKQFLIFLIIYNMCIAKAFGSDYLNQTELKLYFGFSENYYVGNEIKLNLGHGIIINTDIKTYLENTLEGFRFHPKKIIYGFGVKYKMFGYMTYCDHMTDIYITYNSNDNESVKTAKKNIYNALNKPKHRLYFEF